MVDQRKKRFRVSGVDENGDIHAFETDDRERAKAYQEGMMEDLSDVEWETQRWV